MGKTPSVGDWVRIMEVGPAQQCVGPVVEVRGPSSERRTSIRLKVSIRYDWDGSKPDYKRTGLFHLVLPSGVQLLSNLERLYYESADDD